VTNQNEPLEEGTVICECSPTTNPGCPAGDHAEGHPIPATWRVSEPDDHEDFFYLCSPCTAAATARRGLDGYVFDLLEKAGGTA
jgi:hypothetical protein